MTNARLVADIEERNAELTDALALQTATSEVLALISANPGDFATVLDGVIGNAMDLIGAEQGSVMLLEGAGIHMVAARGGTSQVLGTTVRPDSPVIVGETTYSDDRWAENHDWNPELGEFSAPPTSAAAPRSRCTWTANGRNGPRP